VLLCVTLSVMASVAFAAITFISPVTSLSLVLPPWTSFCACVCFLRTRSYIVSLPPVLRACCYVWFLQITRERCCCYFGWFLLGVE
jgi:hypothetical protein